VIVCDANCVKRDITVHEKLERALDMK
jgi:hypothetical protein